MALRAHKVVTRSGKGWEMVISDTSIIIYEDPEDDTALARAVADLNTWSDASLWAGHLIAYHVWVFEPL